MHRTQRLIALAAFLLAFVAVLVLLVLRPGNGIHRATTAAAHAAGPATPAGSRHPAPPGRTRVRAPGNGSLHEVVVRGVRVGAHGARTRVYRYGGSDANGGWPGTTAPDPHRAPLPADDAAARARMDALDLSGTSADAAPAGYRPAAAPTVAKAPRDDLDIPATDPATPGDPDIVAVAPSVVRVLSRGNCVSDAGGSGWVAGPGLIATNAHVVAGFASVQVQPRGTGPTYPARVVWFDPDVDIALLAAPGVHAPPIPLASAPKWGDHGALLGFPLAGPYDAQAATFGKVARFDSPNIYGTQIARTVAWMRTYARHGNSGGPVIDERGHVMLMVSNVTSRSETLAYGVPLQSIKPVLARFSASSATVGNGICRGYV